MSDKENRLYFKQIEMGPMQNFVYLIGSMGSRKIAVVDAAWEIDEILRLTAQDDMEITHAFVTHTHPDHVGGRFAGVEIEGVTELLGKCMKQGALDQDLDSDDRERIVEFLKFYGNLNGDLHYQGSERAGLKKLGSAVICEAPAEGSTIDVV